MFHRIPLRSLATVQVTQHVGFDIITLQALLIASPGKNIVSTRNLIVASFYFVLLTFFCFSAISIFPD
jgi:hypothetical protein